MVWTRFMDMHSGGELKERHQYIYIEAPEEEAKVIFYNRFGHNPERVTCTCCGEDYSISESETLQHASSYERGCEWGKEDEGYLEQARVGYGGYVYDYQPLDKWLESGEALAIYSSQIDPKERVGSLPMQGYVWMG